MELLNKLDAKKQRELQVYCDAHRHKRPTSAVDVTRFTVELMELVDSTPLTPQEKKTLVTALYHDVAKQEENSFDDNMDISDMIELAWDIRQKKFKFGMKKKGCLSWLCCKSCVVGVSPKGVSLGVQTNQKVTSERKVEVVKEPNPTIIINGGAGNDTITVNAGSGTVGSNTVGSNTVDV